MTTYVDASALLRFVLREPGPVVNLPDAEALVSSELIGVEALRTLDRLRLSGALSLEDASTHTAAIGEWLNAIDLVRLGPPVMSRVGLPLPVPLGTLDALHLATALIWRERRDEDVTIATHDAALAQAARTFGFAVAGA